MAENKEIPTYKKQEAQNLANLEELPKHVTLDVLNGFFEYTLDGVKYKAALLLLESLPEGEPDTLPLRSFKRQGKIAVFRVPGAKLPQPMKKANFDNFLSSIATHPESKLLKDGSLSIQGHSITFNTNDPTVEFDHKFLTLAHAEKFQEMLNNAKYITIGEDSKKLVSELTNSPDISYFSDVKKFSAKLNPRVRDFQQVLNGDKAIQKELLMFHPFSQFLPVIGFHKNPMRNTKQVRDYSFLMVSKALLKRELKVHSKSEYPFPGITKCEEEKANVILSLDNPYKKDPLEYLIDYLTYCREHEQAVCVRQAFTPQITWNTVYEKFPYCTFFRTGSLAGSQFGIYFDGANVKTPDPRNKMSNTVAMETLIARYFLLKDVFKVPNIACKITRNAMDFSICTDFEGTKKRFLEIEDLVLNATVQGEVEYYDDFCEDEEGETRNPGQVEGEVDPVEFTEDTSAEDAQTQEQPGSAADSLEEVPESL